MKKYVLLLLIISIVGCSSTSKNKSPSELQKDEVISRIDGLSERPSWLQESEPFKVEKGTVVSLGQTTIPGDNRVEAAYRIAESNAKKNISSAIEQKLSFVFQNAEEGTDIDSNQVQSISGEVSRITTSSIRPGKYYWEKVATTTDSGERVTRYKVFATVTMPENDFKKAVLDALRKRQGKGGISKEFAQKVDKEWERLVEEKAENE